MTPEELAAQREAAQARAAAVPHRQPVARLRADAPRPTRPSSSASRRRARARRSIEDQVQGRVAVQNSELDDFVLLRSDGTPTYMLAVVVDDHDMGVTHVIRGDDHLNNAFRQLAIIRAMGWPEPVYAHVPLIHGAGRRQAVQAPRRARRRRPIATSSASCPRPCSTICSGSAGAMATTRSSRREEAVRWFDLDACRPLAVALRPQEARESQRPLYPRGRRRPAGRPGRAADRGLLGRGLDAATSICSPRRCRC